MGCAPCCMAKNKTLVHLCIACLAAQPQAACMRPPCFAVLAFCHVDTLLLLVVTGSHCSPSSGCASLRCQAPPQVAHGAGTVLLLRGPRYVHWLHCCCPFPPEYWSMLVAAVGTPLKLLLHAAATLKPNSRRFFGTVATHVSTHWSNMHGAWGEPRLPAGVARTHGGRCSSCDLACLHLHPPHRAVLLASVSVAACCVKHVVA